MKMELIDLLAYPILKEHANHDYEERIEQHMNRIAF